MLRPTQWARWQSQWPVRLICLLAAMSLFVPSVKAQDRKIPPAGGSGSRGFIAPVRPLSSMTSQRATDSTKEGKEVFDNYSVAVGTVNPAAGALFKGTGDFLDLVGYFGTAPDPVGDAIRRINERLDDHDVRLAALEVAVQKVQDSLFRIQNVARIRQLRQFKDRLQGILDRLQPASKDRNEKIALARDAQRLAENFLFDVDRDLWNWSDLVLKDHSWQGMPMKAGRLLSPGFKPWPTLEYYTLALVTWMTAVEYAGEGDREWIKQTFGKEIQKHVRLLSIRPGWNSVSGTPETLPEEVRSNIKGWFVPDKYPEKMVCHFTELTTNTIGREIRLVDSIPYAYPARSNDELCTVPAGFWKYPTQGEQDLEREYGTDLMWALADRLSRLRDYGTVREAFVGTFSAANRTIVPSFLYAVRPDGRMLWYRHDGAEQGTTNLIGGTPVSEGWGDFKQVLPGGGNVIHAISREGKNYWYRHDGFNTGARREWTGAKEVGSDWAGFKSVFSGGNGVLYAITKSGKLLLYRHAGHKGGAKLWENAKEVGSDWGNYKTVFSGGDGIVYAITYDGKLLWFKHLGFAQGTNSWVGPKEIKAKGTENWADYKQVFSAGPRTFGTPELPRIALDKVVIYAIDAEGRLWWYGHRGYGTGANFLNDRALIGSGWGDFTSVFALLPDAAEAVR